MTIPLSQDIRNFGDMLLASNSAVVIEPEAKPALRGAFAQLVAQARQLEIDLACMEAIARELDLVPVAVGRGGDASSVSPAPEGAAQDDLAETIRSLPADTPISMANGKVVLLNRRRPAFCDGRGPEGGAA